MVRNELLADSVYKCFGSWEILTDCFVRCYTGEVVGILGRNGCGKSTFLKIIFGAMAAEHKYVSINGKKYDAPYKTKGLMGYLPQHDFLPGNLTVEEVIRLYADSRDERERLLQHAWVISYLHHKVDALSGGECRYLEILLLVNSPVQFVLLDEPFNGLDPLMKEKVVALIQVARASKGFIITDHDYRNIIATSDRIILVTNGVFKNIRDPEELEQWQYLPPGHAKELRS